YKTLFRQGLTNWAVGFNVQIPLRNRSLEAQMAQLKVQKQQNLMNGKQTEQQITVEIRNAVQALDTNKKRVETARVARQLAEEQLEGETKRFQAGLSQNFQVLDRQRQLSFQQGVELQNLIAYKKAVINLQKAMYTLIDANDFEIAKTSADVAFDFYNKSGSKERAVASSPFKPSTESPKFTFFGLRPSAAT